ncbi:hypothetical protein JOB18_041595 [Solea senegalensis]|uniref:Uncharacterized protein n=1 Tax=Solea senegalensis TaxID=28829 RepID=A0AAV6R7I8_SOLSE|nr:hypothetical protein JOB18_041595 [Solea senegalensis]
MQAFRLRLNHSAAEGARQQSTGTSVTDKGKKKPTYLADMRLHPGETPAEPHSQDRNTGQPRCKWRPRYQ